MELLKHDLQHEFPQQLEKMKQLKAADAHFSSLALQYDAHNHRITSLARKATSFRSGM